MAETETQYSIKNFDIIKKSHLICMLPHKTIWEAAHVASIIVHIYIATITFTYASTLNKDLHYYVLLYSLELMYFMYITFTFVHRNFSIHSKDYCTNQMPFLHMVFGMITLIPFYEIYIFLVNFAIHEKVRDILNLRVIFRLSHVLIYFSRQRKECSGNRTGTILIETFAIISLYVCFVSCIVGWIGCYGCEFSNWTTHLKDTLYDDTNFWSRLLYPMVFIGGLVMGNYSGLLIPETIPEIIVVLVTMAVGFCIKVNFMLAQYISEYVTTHWRHTMYKMRLRTITNFIQFEELSKASKTDILEYYNALWNKRYGIVNWKKSYFDLLPGSLKNEIKLDLSWDALSHSHLFRDALLPVKMAVSHLMTDHFMVKGEAIYDTGDMRYSLIYIASGIVQLLSDEDDESPIMSFTSGTVISEFACLMPAPSEAKLICASYCELRVLRLDNFYRGMTFYKAEVLDLQDKIRDRLGFVKRMQALKRHYRERPTLPIGRIKQRWKEMLTGKIGDMEYHTSKYMDLFTLGDELDLKVEVICLTSKFPLIMDPDSSFRAFTEYIVLIACIIQTMIIPYYAAFAREITSEMRTFLLLLDCLYILDIYLQVTTAITVNKTLIVKMTAILLHRVKQISFLVDVFASFPLDYIQWARGCSQRDFIMWKIPRVLKIYKLTKLVRKFEQSMVNVNGSLIILLKYNLLWMLCVYFFACFLYLTSCFTDKCVPFTWFPYNVELASLNNTQVKPVMISFLCVVDVFSFGKQNFYFYSRTDNFMHLMMILFCYYLIPMATADMSATQYWKMQQVADNKSFISSVIAYLQSHHLPQELIDSVQNTLKHRWAHNQGLFELSASEFLRELPSKLEERVREELIGPWLDNLTLFQTLEDTVRKRIIQMAEMISYPEGAIVVRPNETIWNLYIIKRGVCEVTSVVPGDAERKTDKWTFSPGDCFPLLEILHIVPSFLKVTALTAVDTIVIPYKQMFRTLKYDTMYYNVLRATLESHLAAHKQTLLRLPTRLQPVHTKPLVTVDYFKYIVDDNINAEVKKLPLFKRTIDPHSKMYITYEVIHCICVVFQFVILVLKLNVLYEYRETIDMLNVICDARCYIDIFIRLYVQYHRSDGILITHYKSVRNYYVRHAFAVDLYGTSPITLLAMDAMKEHFNPIVVKHSLLLLTRPVQLYRVFIGIECLCKSMKILTEATIRRIQSFLLIMVLIPIGCNFLTMCVCKIDYVTFSCSMVGWKGGDITEITSSTALAHYTFLTALYIHGSPKNGYGEHSHFTYAYYILFTVISVTLSWFFLSSLVGLGLHGKYASLQVQNDRRNFIIFAKNEGITSSISEKVLLVNTYLNRYIPSVALIEAEKRMPPQLYRDVSFALNEGILSKNALFFDAGKHVQRDMTCMFNRFYSMKDDTIIRNNDINEYIYIVKLGRVAISIANQQLAVLSVGGMFGCLTHDKRLRQTIDAATLMHSEILRIKSADFNGLIYDHPVIKNRIRTYMLQGIEYVIAKEDTQIHITEDVDLAILTLVATTIDKRYRYSRFFRNFVQTHEASLKALAIFRHVLYMHISAFSVMFTFLYQLLAMHHDLPIAMYVILYLIDAIFWANLLLGITLPYVDEASGLLILNPRIIIRRYLKNHVFLDLSVVLPLELMFSSLMPSRLATALLTSNRVLRIIYIIRHYKSYMKQAKLTHFYRWIYITYIVLIYIQFFTNVWHYFACHRNECRYRRFVSNDPEEYIAVLGEIYGYLFSYTHVVNFFTGNGLKAIKPLNVTEIIVTFALVVSSTFMMAFMISSYALVQIIDNYNLTTYRNCLNEVTVHLTDLHVSPVILTKVVRYYDSLWKNQRGEQWPSLIWDTRRYLHENVMVDLYSSIFINHIIFRDTHMDFIRQLLPFVKRVVYHQSMIIVEQNFKNGHMYIIHSGRVFIIEDMGDETSRKVTTLYAGQGFGEEQGLIDLPHKYTYVTDSQVVLLALCKTDWMYMLDYFPASRHDILLHLRAILDPARRATINL